MDEERSEADFMAAVAQIVKRSPQALSVTGAAVLLAIHMGIATDSRSIANRLGLAHALVLREISALSPRFVQVTKRDTRTQRSWLEMTTDGRALAAPPPHI